MILDGTSEIGARVRSNLCNLLCLRHSIISRVAREQVKTYIPPFVRNFFWATIKFKYRAL